MATFKSNITQVLEIKITDLDSDVVSILEPFLELTPADARDQMWLTRTATLLETMQDSDLLEDKDDSIRTKWTAFVKRLDTLNAISPFKYVMILQNFDDATNEKRIYKRYAIVQHIDDGSETLEDYDNEETARKAFEAIRTNGYHVSEYEDRPDEKIIFDEFEKVVFTMDIELWDERGNHEGFETIEFTPIEMRNGKVVEEAKIEVKVLREDKPFLEYASFSKNDNVFQGYLQFENKHFDVSTCQMSTDDDGRPCIDVMVHECECNCVPEFRCSYEIYPPKEIANLDGLYWLMDMRKNKEELYFNFYYFDFESEAVLATWFSPDKKARTAKHGLELSLQMIERKSASEVIDDDMYSDLLYAYEDVMDTQKFEEYEFHNIDDIKNNPGTAIQHIRDVCKKAVEASV